VVRRARVADVAHAVQIIRREKKDRARAGTLRLPVDGHLHHAFFHEDQLFVRMTMSGVRGFVRVYGGDMVREVFHGHGRPLQHVAAFTDFRGLNLKFLPIENPRRAGRSFVVLRRIMGRGGREVDDPVGCARIAHVGDCVCII
jgi:hypothetical protein